MDLKIHISAHYYSGTQRRVMSGDEFAAPTFFGLGSAKRSQEYNDKGYKKPINVMGRVPFPEKSTYPKKKGKFTPKEADRCSGQLYGHARMSHLKDKLRISITCEAMPELYIDVMLPVEDVQRVLDSKPDEHW